MKKFLSVLVGIFILASCSACSLASKTFTHLETADAIKFMAEEKNYQTAPKSP